MLEEQGVDKTAEKEYYIVKAWDISSMRLDPTSDRTVPKGETMEYESIGRGIEKGVRWGEREKNESALQELVVQSTS